VNYTRTVTFRISYLLSALLALTTVARADDWAPNLTMTATWHSNATLADESDDQLESLQLSADMLASERYEFGRDDTLRLSGHLAGDWWPRYDALLRGAVGGRAELRHRFGPGPRAPAIAIEGAVDAVEAKETGRRGTSTGVTASVRKRINDLFRATAWYEVSWHLARLETYDAAASEGAIEIDYDFSKEMRLTFTARYRDGDVISYASGFRPDLEARAPNRLDVDTFDREMTAYRIDAETWSGRLSLVRALDTSSAILVAYERRETRRGPLRFPDHLLSVAMVHQF